MTPAAFTAATVSRRSLLLGGAALGGSFLLSGCIGGSPAPASSAAGSAASSGPLTLQSDLSDPKPKAALESVVKGYTKYPVTLNTVAIEQFRAQLSTYLTSANPPDVITWYAGSVARDYASKGLLLDVSDMWTGDGACASFSPALKALSSGDDGKQIFVPTSYYWWSVFYRKSAFEEWGVKIPTTWDEFMTLCDTLKGKGIYPLTNGTGSTRLDGIGLVRLPGSADQRCAVPPRPAGRQALVRQRRGAQGDGHLRHAHSRTSTRRAARTAGRRPPRRWSTRRPACT